MKKYSVYILSNIKNGTLYVGMTSDLSKRIFEHKSDLVEGFTKKYRTHSLVYYEITEDVYSAICREKQLKNWKREWKLALIEKENPEWNDLSKEFS